MAKYDEHFGGQTLGGLDQAKSPLLAMVATDSIKQERIAFTAKQVLRFPIGGADHEVESKRIATGPVAGGVPLALAVAASSCFPPLFPRMLITHHDLGLNYSDFKDSFALNDGGVTDNLGLGVLLELKSIGQELGDRILVCNAERPLRDKPGNSPLTDQAAQSAALSGAVEKVVAALGHDCSFARIVDRPALPLGLAFTVQTRLAVFRTDLDAPSWKEVQALLLHGFSCAARALDADGYASMSPEASRSRVASILRIAGCEETLAEPSAEEFARSHSRPKRRIVTHLLLFLVVVLTLLSGMFCLSIRLAREAGILSAANVSKLSGIVYLEGAPLPNAIIELPEARIETNSIRIFPTNGGKFEFIGREDFVAPVRVIVHYDPKKGFYPAYRDVTPSVKGLTRIELTAKDVRRIKDTVILGLMFGGDYVGAVTPALQMEAATMVSAWNAALAGGNLTALYPFTEDLVAGDIFLAETESGLGSLFARLSLQASTSSVKLPAFGFAVDDSSSPFEAFRVGLSFLNTKEAEGTLDFGAARIMKISLIDLQKGLQTWAKQNQDALKQLVASDESARLRVVTSVVIIDRINISVSVPPQTGPDDSDVNLVTLAEPTDVLSTNYSGLLNSFTNSSITGSGNLKIKAASARSVAMTEEFSRPFVIAYSAVDVVVTSDGRLGLPEPIASKRQ